MRADAKYHPECKDAERRERERGGKLRDRLVQDFEAATQERARIIARQVELDMELQEATLIASTCLEAIDRLDEKPRKPLWRVLTEIWAPERREHGSDPAKGRTGADNRDYCDSVYLFHGNRVSCDEPNGHGGTHHRGMTHEGHQVAWRNEDAL
jgi:hypothetical protein